jgi:hypothetical protein
MAPIPASALPNPALERLGRPPGRLMLAVTPCPARTVLVELFPARAADHMPIIKARYPAGRPGRKRSGPATRWRGRDKLARLDQAALARRIRRRRSEARSSSFRAPQVPYFSGLLSA